MSKISEGGPAVAAETRETAVDRAPRDGDPPAARRRRRWWWSCPAWAQTDPEMHRSAGLLWTFASGQGG